MLCQYIKNPQIIKTLCSKNLGIEFYCPHLTGMNSLKLPAIMLLE